ncbi:alanine racemase [Clostridium sp. AF18-27]|uniref:D-serine deaminase, pyridoxal phosphate-dependent n=5 Tax=Enterocloster TaxID=2719313 RepID=A0A1I0C8I1_9FIRM|nr:MULTISPECIES: alanine racemase [Enterocloster]MBS5607288.1 alanine racemase [Enterocloster asparagiformis]RHR57558.1 alanine racemase [Clostridium sp. AF18-27]MDR3755476.1 alanine racemase [Enterocloster sp.]PST34215.1 alanine racemase [Enterocloster lavalensis]SET15850.1 D-serine deaminase, pyridoxal phosphate-dependent [Enterocloster lavalensis]
MNYMELDTPALIIDREIMMDNLRFMQEYADRRHVALRPHTKTHKMPRLALIQEELGARGVTVAKVGEAEVMAEAGLRDIFIANEIVGESKLARIRELAKTVDISFGLDSIPQAEMIERAFAGAQKPARVLIEIEVGEERSGVIEEADYLELLEYLKGCKNISLKGIFSHDGNSYQAADIRECREIHLTAQRRTLRFAELAKEAGMELETVSIGSTPSMMHDFPILDGVTEIRPGTYIFMDASQANAYGSLARNAATILTTVISRPTPERVITDVGAKGITAQTRSKGFCATRGLGLIKGWPEVEIFDVYDEHAIIYNKAFHDGVRVGDKVEIIPNHICPVVNLHETAYLVTDGEVVEEIPVACRGKLK